MVSWLVHGLLIVMVAGVILPLLWTVSSSLKTNNEMFNGAWSLPANPVWSNFSTAWNQGVVDYLLNSVLVTVASVVGVVLISAWGAYALSRLRIPFAGALTMLVIGGMMLAPTVALIPLFQLLQSIELLDTRWALVILYVAFRISFTLFLIRAYMLTLPRDVEEAAVIDGASHWQIFWRIILPLCKPVLISAGLLQAIFAWNEFAFALVFINTNSKMTLPVGLMSMQSRLTTDWPVMFAALVIAALPMMIAFIVGQRHFIRGLAEGFGK